MGDRNKKETIQEKLNFYHDKLLELDETETEDYELPEWWNEPCGAHSGVQVLSELSGSLHVHLPGMSLAAHSIHGGDEYSRTRSDARFTNESLQTGLFPLLRLWLSQFR